MKTIFTDASFDYRHTNETKENFVRGKICIKSDDFQTVDHVAIGKVPGLKQYINILELTAIARAIELATLNGWEKNIRVNTDSQVARFWAIKGKTNSKVSTDAHVNALEYLKRVRTEFGGIVVIEHVSREQNPAGFVLEKELERERPHAI